MAELTKEYFDNRLSELANKSDLKGLEDKLTEKIDDLAVITAHGFEEIKKELDLRKEVAKLKEDVHALKKAVGLAH